MENLRGILLMVVSMACFSLADMFIKQVSTRLAVGEILLFIGLGGTLVFSLMARRMGQKIIGRDFFSSVMVIRNLAEMIGTFGFVTALALTPISSASAIFQATPLAVTLGAALFLHEPVGWRRWGAIFVGFGGVLLILRPGFAGFQVASLYAVLAVIALSVRDLATRAAPRGISSIRLGVYGFLMLVLSGVVLLILDGPYRGPTLPEAGALGAAMGLDIVGYYTLTLAMRLGDVSVITPFRYVRILYALIIGMLVFAERPDAPTLLGTAIIIISGLYTFARERKRRQAA